MENTLEIGIISDTHGRLTNVAYKALAGCDHIIHAGDIGDPEIIRMLETLASVTAVLGNNDFDEYGKQIKRFAFPRLADIPFLVTHYPEDAYITGRGNKAIAPGDPLPRICVHGHTHVPKITTGKEAGLAEMIVCPGSPTSPRHGSKPSIAKLTLAPGKIVSSRIQELQ